MARPKETLAEQGTRWASEDYARSMERNPNAEPEPVSRWGNIELDDAYDARWLHLTGKECQR